MIYFITTIRYSYAINKRSKDFVKSSDETKGSKRSLAFVMQHLENHGFVGGTVWANMCDIILKTLLPRLAASYRNFFGADQARGRQFGPACFEILGFDIMLDDTVTISIIMTLECDIL